MPIGNAGGRRGLSGILAIPGRRFAAAKPNSASPLTHSSKPFRSKPFDAITRYIVGVTKDSAGAALGSVVVQLFRTSDDAFMGEMTSDGSGNFTFASPGNFNCYIVAYKAGATDVAGTTINTLLGV